MVEQTTYLSTLSSLTPGNDKNIEDGTASQHPTHLIKKKDSLSGTYNLPSHKTEAFLLIALLSDLCFLLFVLYLTCMLALNKSV